MDTNTTNPAATVNPTATVIMQKPTRIKHAVSYGICRGTEAGVKILDASAEVVSAVATRIKLHNLSTAADIIEEYGKDNVTEAKALIEGL